MREREGVLFELYWYTVQGQVVWGANRAHLEPADPARAGGPMSLHAVILAGGAERASGRSRGRRSQAVPLLGDGSDADRRDVRPNRAALLVGAHLGGLRQGSRRGVRQALPDLEDKHVLVRTGGAEHSSGHRARLRHALREDPDATLMILPATTTSRGRTRSALPSPPPRSVPERRPPHLGHPADARGDGLRLPAARRRKAPGVFAVDAFVEKPDAATGAAGTCRTRPIPGTRASFVFRARCDAGGAQAATCRRSMRD